MSAYRTSVEIEAAPEHVFRHFLQPELLVRWMGDWAALEATAGGTFAVDINGVIIRGHYVRVEPPHLLEIAWGEAGNALMPPGATRVRLTFEPRGEGTLLTLEHEGLVEVEAAKHAIGWPHFLGRLAVFAAGGDPGPDPFAQR